MTRASVVISAGLLALGAQPLAAQTPTFAENTDAAIREFRAALAATPDLKHGAQLFDTCAACHGADGRGARDGTVPAIAGQHVSVLVKQLVDFRHDRRWDERMQNFSSTHHLQGPPDLLDVASYAQSLPRWPPLEGGTGDGKSLQRGANAYFIQCEGCHGPLGEGELRRLRPRLAGQHYEYLMREMEQTAAGGRPGMDAEHVTRIRKLSPEEREGIADYLSRLSPDVASNHPRQE
ncbi:MAG TPA: c-type cytochrome [Steroidobacteraceae bacterium]|nr:c-type cytochrome [Steroidobacteraceae bacterium]